MCTYVVTVAALALAAFASSAMAQEQEDEQKRVMREGVTRNEFTRHVASGRSVVLNFVHSINPDCSSAGDPDVRLVKAPEHGVVAIVSGEGFANYAKDNVRAKCNGKRVHGVNVSYKSSPGYTGTDAFELLSMSPTGFAWEIVYRVDVR
jgi:hypothetical protein